MKTWTLALAGLLALPLLGGCNVNGGGAMEQGNNDSAAPAAASAPAAATAPATAPAPASAPASASASGAVTSAGVREQVQVEASGGKVVVRMEAENSGAATVYVPKAVFEDDTIFRREFEVTHAQSGAEVDYTGPMVKRGPFTRDDYLALKPGARVVNSIDITHSYDFKPGSTYVLKYPGAYLNDVAQLNAMSSAPVPAVTFTVK